MRKKGKREEHHTFVSTLERSDNKLWGAHIRVPRHIAKKLTSAESRRVVCTLNGTVKHQTALLPYRRGIYVIRMNKLLQKKLGLAPGSQLAVKLEKDETPYGLPLPEELKELLRQDAEGNTLFHALSKGKQRTLLYIVGSVKDPDKRIHRALAILRHLKTQNGMIDYKKLSLSLRDPQRGLR
jgi:hypothetical protein